MTRSGTFHHDRWNLLSSRVVPPDRRIRGRQVTVMDFEGCIAGWVWSNKSMISASTTSKVEIPDSTHSTPVLWLTVVVFTVS
jgi:uncharacterized membrane protein YpjA